jgi:hypothetical protein
VLAALTVALLVWLGWGRAAGLGWRRPDRTWWLAVRLLVEALLFGLLGLGTDRALLLSTALLCAAIGTAEESFSRGLVQRVLTPFGPLIAAVWVGVLFGLGHALSGAWSRRPWDDTVSVVVSAGCYGFCLAALRWHLGTIWPLAFLHGLDDFLQLASPGNLPFAVRLALVCALVGYGWWLLLRLAAGTGEPGALLAEK